MNKAWQLQPATPPACQTLSDALGIAPLVAQVLINRGLDTPAAAAEFLQPQLSALHNPFLLPDMDRAVARIIVALRAREPITIYGDYDVDGTTATALLYRFFQGIGVTVDYYIPHREREGYGLSAAAVQAIAAQGTRLLITVDNGSTAHAAITAARSAGIDVIVTDHHEIDEPPADAVAVINPKRRDSTYPFRELCGVGVAFKLVMALRHRLREEPALMPLGEPNLKQWLDLVAVGTIADVVPLVGENRILCYFGLGKLATNPQTGLAAILRVAGIGGDRIDPYTVGFQIGPRINAAGRLGDARQAVELLTTEDPPHALELARTLQQLNSERQAIETRILGDIHAQVRSDPQLLTRSSLVLADPQWPAGVIGIVASRIAESYRLPTILISLASEIGRGSGRSIGGFPLLEAIAPCADTLEQFGGHAVAAGVTIRAERVDAFRAAFEASCRERLTPAHRERQVRIDAHIDATDITLELAHELAALRPFGLGNPEPVFSAHNLEVRDRRVVGSKHLRLQLQSPAGRAPLEAIAFGHAEHPAAQAPRLDLAFAIAPNTWNGRTTVQLQVKDLRTAEI